MTLKSGHFTLNFHCYELRFQQLGYILTVESVYICDQRRYAEADREVATAGFRLLLYRVGDYVMHLCPICNRRTINVLDDDDDDDDVIRRIFGIREKKLRIFRGPYIVRSLTNKANISTYYYLVHYRLSIDLE